MVITLTVSTIWLIAGQIAAATAGQMYSTYTSRKIKQIREQAKLDAIKKEQGRDDERFLNTLRAQLEIETLSHQENIADIENSFKNAFIKLAHKEALSNYPLWISPYLIRKNILSFNYCEIAGQKKQPQLFCVLSNSNNSLFNQEVFPLVDSMVSSYLNMYWNAKTTHTVCYYEGIWNNSVTFDDGHSKNLQALIPFAPIVMITPYLEPDKDGFKFLIKVNYWGNDEVFIEPTGLESLKLSSSLSFEAKTSIAEIILPWLVCSIAYFADVFYWMTNKDYPILPLLLNKGVFQNKNLLSFYSEGYLGLANKCLVVRDSTRESDNKTEEDIVTDNPLNDIVALNTYHFPEQNIAFLRSALTIVNDIEKCESLIYDFSISLLNAKTGAAEHDLSSVNINRLNMDDMRAVTQIINIATDSKAFLVRAGLVDLLKRKIESPLDIN